MKIKRIELELGDDILITFKGLWNKCDLEVSYTDERVRVHRDGSNSGNCIHDVLKLSK